MDDTQKDGSDSDWDSTLDFTSPRQVGIGRLRHDPATEVDIDEESALSEESDMEGQQSIAHDQQVIKNVLKSQDNRPRAPSPKQKENNLVLAQKQQNAQQQRQQQQANQTRQPANQANQQQQRRVEPDPPPYNFRDALQENGAPDRTQVKGPPGKDRKGTDYDPAPSPSPRGIQKKQGSIRSVGSWDESDADERTLREIRTQYQQEKQKEVEQKNKEVSFDSLDDSDEQQDSIVEEPQTARSESTWKGWKFGKKNKNKNNNSTKGSTAGTPRSQAQPLSARSQQGQGDEQRSRSMAQFQATQAQVQAQTRVQGQGQTRAQGEGQGQMKGSQVTRMPAAPVLAPLNIARETVTSPSMVDVLDQRYSTAGDVAGDDPMYATVDRAHMPTIERARLPVERAQMPVDRVQIPMNRAQYPAHIPMDRLNMPVDNSWEVDTEEPRKLIDKDEDSGRYIYYFGHGNRHYLEVNDDYAEAVLPSVADKVDSVIQRIWQEFFAILRIILSIIIWFCVELLKFLAKHIFHPLILGIFMAFGDHVFKPILSVMFNGFIQPSSIFLWNVFTGMRHMFNPIGDILWRVFEAFAMLFRSIRLFDMTYVAASSQDLQQRRIETV